MSSSNIFNPDEITYELSVQHLCDLLKVNIRELDTEKVKKLVRKRYLQWHPDKGVSSNEELFKLLNVSYNRYLKGDEEILLTCDEVFESFGFNDDSDSDYSEYNDTPFSDSSFKVSPKKGIEVPEFIKKFMRSNNNRRAGKFFFVIFDKNSDLSKISENVLKCEVERAYLFSNTLIMHLNQNRIKAEVNVHFFNFKNYIIEYAINFTSLLCTCKDLYTKCDQEWGNISQNVTLKNFSQKLLTEYALIENSSDVFYIMESYAHLASNCTQSNPSNEHVELHNEHKDNATVFLSLNDRYKAAKSASMVVIAKLHTLVGSLTNIKYLEQKINLSDFDQKTISDAAIWIYSIYEKDFMNKIFTYITETYIIGQPKRRYTILTGPFGCGKSTIASAFCDLFQGVNININVSKERLNFHLGQALGHRFVLFDDVKGAATGDLGQGQGFFNLDDLRDHLDGVLRVPVERKNIQPQNVKFPAGIITCNEYSIPPSLRERCKIFKLKQVKGVKFHKDLTFDSNVLAVILILLNIIPAPAGSGSIGELVNKADVIHAVHVMNCVWCTDKKRSKSKVSIFLSL